MSFTIKNNAFFEEAEYRICFLPDLAYLKNILEKDTTYKILPQSFRLIGNTIRPYYSFDFCHVKNFISEIVLGPRCTTPAKVIKAFLEKNGLTGVTITKSRASLV